jgi:hypothetical protein
MAIRERRNQGPSGLADVRYGKTSVKIIFKDAVYELPLDAVEKRSSGSYNVTMTADKSKAYLHPVAGQYILTFKQLGNRVNSIPQSKIQRGGVRQKKDGKGTWFAPDENVFAAVFQIESEGNYKGMTSSTNLPFSFASPMQGDSCDIVDSKRNITRLETFFRVVGGVENLGMFEIPYLPDPSAILIWIEQYMISQGKVFLGTISERGFIDIDTISTIPADLLPHKKQAKSKVK